jgi:hypothetical protein
MKKLHASGCSRALFHHPPRLPTNDGNRNLHHFQQYPLRLIVVFSRVTSMRVDWPASSLIKKPE